MRAYVINIMVVLTILPVILQTVINMIMLSIGGQGVTETRLKNSICLTNLILSKSTPKIA